MLSKKNIYHGLSLLDRLNKAGVTQSFAEAVHTRDRAKMLRILYSVAYNGAAAEATAQTFANKPDSFRS